MFSSTDNFTFPPMGNYPIITFIPESRFDERGRQLQFVESNVQRQERLAFLKASRKPKGESSKDWWSSFSDYSSSSGSGRSSPTSSICSTRSSSSESSSPTHSPYSESRVLDITNTYPEPYLFYSSGPLPSSSLSLYGGSTTTQPRSPTNTVTFAVSPPGVSINSVSSSSSNFKRGHRRQSSSLHGLHAIPEED